MTPSTLVVEPASRTPGSPATPGLLRSHHLKVGGSVRFVRSLTETLDAALVGGKAATLARLAAMDVPVPAGVVITAAAFDAWLDDGTPGDGRVRAQIDHVLTATPAGDVEALQQRSAAVRDIVLQAPLCEALTTTLDEVAAAMLPHAPLVVRSSAVGEDGAHSSFAGQLDSILHVLTRADLERALRICWASYWSPRVLSYRAARGAALAGMGVIVQRQVPAAIAGVLFTMDPLDSDAIAIEYGDGVADRLVSGEIEPVRVTLKRDDASNVPDERLQASGLVDIALRIERAFGAPQDIEWAIDADGSTWIVQARPITSNAARPAISSGATTVWSNANVSENFPEPISPLLYSIASQGYYHYFRNLGLAFGVSRRRLRAMDAPLHGIIGVHGARMYYNLTNVHAVLRLAPFGEALAAAFNQFVGVNEVAPPPAGAATWGDPRSRIAQALELVRIGAATTWQYLFIGRRIASFERTADAFAARTAPGTLGERALPALAADLRAFLDIRCHKWRNASLADAAAMVCYALLARATEAAGKGTLHNGLLRALPGVPSAEPARRLWALSRLVRADRDLLALFEQEDAASVLHEIRTDAHHASFRRELDRYLDEWGFRSSSELMLTVPTFQEEPVPVIELLQQSCRSDEGAPDALMAAQAALRVQDTRRLLRPLVLRAPHRAMALWVLVKWTQRAVAFRERARLKQALLYTRCRHIALAIGRHLVRRGHLTTADDVFMLRIDEIDDLISGRAMFAHGVSDLVAQRHAQHAELAATTPPDRFECGEGAYLPMTARRSVHAEHAPAALAGEGERLTGTSACGGRIRARAAVFQDVREADRLSRGDILVTRQTDPGWGPIFGLIGGLIIERGGMLSHGAIIAREFGLPCIVGVKDATTRIGHGDLVLLDGDSGTCTIDARADGSPR